MGDDGEGQFNAAHRLKKVTKYILRTEQDASIFAIKANKYATIAYLDRLAAWNQFHAIWNQQHAAWNRFHAAWNVL